jgi:hypothetical protein
VTTACGITSQVSIALSSLDIRPPSASMLAGSDGTVSPCCDFTQITVHVRLGRHSHIGLGSSSPFV